MFKNLLLIYTRIFDPFVVICAAYTLIFLKLGAFPQDLFLLGFTIVVNLIIPFFYFVKLLREKRVGNWDVTNRKERRKIFGPLIIFVTISTIILSSCRFIPWCAENGLQIQSSVMISYYRTLLWGYLLKIQIAGILLFIYLYLISPHFKSSGHVGTMSVIFPFLLKIYGFSAWWFIILIILQGVARVKLKKHTIPEALAGFISGIIIGAIASNLTI